MQIIGAGLAGLLAANMLRRHDPMVMEAQPSLPNNHHAVLRFRSEEVSSQLRIPFRRVQVFKSCDEPDPIRAAMLYSRKVTGRYEIRSLINLEPSIRFIAPPDLVARMAEGIAINFNSSIRSFPDEEAPYISTMPMEALMNLLKYPGPRPAFVSHPGWVVTCDIEDCDVFITRYFPKHAGPVYRASITGNHLAIEAVGEIDDKLPLSSGIDPITLVRRVMMDFGITGDHGAPKVHKMRFAKIGELSAADRKLAKDFMFWATTERGIYSLGRFATWRAGLLMDDLVNDILTIERWITGGSRYEIRRHI